MLEEKNTLGFYQSIIYVNLHRGRRFIHISPHMNHNIILRCRLFNYYNIHTVEEYIFHYTGVVSIMGTQL
jgi:hypothetical protein